MGILDSVTGIFKSGSNQTPSYGTEDFIPGVTDAQSSGFKMPGIVDSALNLLDPSNARLSVAGLLRGGTKVNKNAVNTIGFNISGSAGATDWRVRISLADKATYFYNSPSKGILAPLFSGSQASGVIFPYTPSISVQHTARYGSQSTTHSNYNNYFYEGSEVQAITISGDFSVQNDTEAKYLLAAVYFFRACTKMWFGNGANAGNPPPVVFLDGYGSHYFPHVSCVITNFTHQLPAEVDYIETTSYNGSTRVPTISNVSVTLQPVVSRSKAREFDLDAFARGDLITTSRGGFL